MTTVTLKLKDAEGNIQKKNHEVEAIDVFQLKKTMTAVNEIMSSLSGNSKIIKLLQEGYAAFNKRQAPREDYEALTVSDLKERIEHYGLTVKPDAKKAALVDILMDADKQALGDRNLSDIIPNLGEAFQVLLVELPDQAIELLSVLSYVKKEELERQKVLDVMDIFDAVVEENDIEKLVARVKKSLVQTQAKTAFLTQVKKMGQKMAQGQS